MSVRPTVLLLVALVCACGSPPEDREVEPGDWAGATLETPLPRPDFVLTDMAGRPFDFREETRGFLTLLFFGYTHCPDVCPVQMANLAEVMRDLPREVSSRVKVVFVTTDPDRDTPERLREWLGSLHPAFIGLRGTAGEVQELLAGLGLPPAVVQPGDSTAPDAYFVGHAAQVIAFEPDGPARHVYPYGTRQRDWLRDLPRLLEPSAGSAGAG